MIRCMGTIPGTSEICGSDLIETDGRQFYLQSPIGEKFMLELDPPRLCCTKCGYKTRLRYSQKVDSIGKVT